LRHAGSGFLWLRSDYHLLRTPREEDDNARLTIAGFKILEEKFRIQRIR
jgi:hypothetical protein